MASSFRLPIAGGLRHPGWLLLPPLAFLGLFYLWPLGAMVRYSFYRPAVGTVISGGVTLANYIEFFSSPTYLFILGRTLLIGAVVTGLTLLMGYPLALTLAKGPASIRKWLLLIVLSPLLIAVIVRSFGWMLLLGLDGPVNRALLALGLVEQPVKFLFNHLGLIIGLTHVYLPFMVLPLAAALERIDPAVEDAAVTLGATPLALFRRVVFPLSLPGVAAGSVLVFTLSVSAYVTPALLGGAGYRVIPTFVAQQITVLLNWPLGSAIAVVLVLVTLAAVTAYQALLNTSLRHLQGREA
jgi:putative spermidine/putrescine transport system permease protein